MKALEYSLREPPFGEDPPCGAAFQGVDETGRKRSDDLPIATAYAQRNRSELLHQVQLAIGLSVSF